MIFNATLSGRLTHHLDQLSANTGNTASQIKGLTQATLNLVTAYGMDKVMHALKKSQIPGDVVSVSPETVEKKTAFCESFLSLGEFAQALEGRDKNAIAKAMSSAIIGAASPDYSALRKLSGETFLPAANLANTLIEEIKTHAKQVVHERAQHSIPKSQQFPEEPRIQGTPKLEMARDKAAPGEKPPRLR